MQEGKREDDGTNKPDTLQNEMGGVGKGCMHAVAED